MALFAGCGCADQKKAVRENTETVQETGTEALSKLMDNTEEATEVAEVTETTEASETSDPAASASGNDATTSGSTAAKADTNKSAAKSGSKSDSTSGSASQASQPAVASGSDNTTQAAAPAQTQASSAQPAAHEHHWEQYVKDTINHPEVGHYETKVVQAAYDEPKYEEHNVCNKCGFDMGTDDELLMDHYAFDCDGSYSLVPVQVGTIHHDAVTEQVYVVDQAAWTEQVYGYRCSCGATK